MFKKPYLAALFLTLCIPERNIHCFDKQDALLLRDLGALIAGFVALKRLIDFTDKRHQQAYDNKQAAKEAFEKVQKLAQEQMHKAEQLALEKATIVQEIQRQKDLEHQQALKHYCLNNFWDF